MEQDIYIKKRNDRVRTVHFPADMNENVRVKVLQNNWYKKQN